MPKGLLYQSTIHAPNPTPGRRSACGSLESCDISVANIDEVDITDMLDTHDDTTLCGHCFPTGDPQITKPPADDDPKSHQRAAAITNAQPPQPATTPDEP